MSPFTRFSQAIEVSRQHKADTVIRRYKHLIAPEHFDVLPEAIRQAIEPRSNHAVRTSQYSLSETRGVMRPSKTSADIGDTALPLHRFEKWSDRNNPGAMVVAGAWLVLFVLALTGFEFRQVTAALASLN